MTTRPTILATIRTQTGKAQSWDPPDTFSLSQLGVDSLAVYEFAIELENELGIHIPDKTIGSWRTLADVIKTTDALVAAK